VPAAQSVGDIVMGSVMCQSSKRANEIRMAALVTGIPDTVPVYTVNRCAPPAA
jgi:acetyl-CoA acetyltransferase